MPSPTRTTQAPTVPAPAWSGAAAGRAEIPARGAQRGDRSGDGGGATGEVEEPDDREGEERAADPDPQRGRLGRGGRVDVDVGGGVGGLGVGGRGGPAAVGADVEAGQPAEEADDGDRVAGLPDERAERVGEALADRAGQVRCEAEAGEDGEDEQPDAGRVAAVAAELAAGLGGELAAGRVGLGAAAAARAGAAAGPGGPGARGLRASGGAGRHRLTLTPASKASADTLAVWGHRSDRGWVRARGRTRRRPDTPAR